MYKTGNALKRKYAGLQAVSKHDFALGQAAPHVRSGLRHCDLQQSDHVLDACTSTHQRDTKRNSSTELERTLVLLNVIEPGTQTCPDADAHSEGHAFWNRGRERQALTLYKGKKN